MAKLALVYGLRMVPSDEVEAVTDGEIKLQGDRKAHVTMHLIEGETEAQIKERLLQSLDAFFEFYPNL